VTEPVRLYAIELGAKSFHTKDSLPNFFILKNTFITQLDPNSVMVTGGIVCFFASIMLLSQASKMDGFKNILRLLAACLAGGAMALALVVADSGINNPLRMVTANIIGTLTYFAAMACFIQLYRPEIKNNAQIGLVVFWIVGCFVFTDMRTFYMWNQIARIAILIYITSFMLFAKDPDAPGLCWFATLIPVFSIIGLSPQLFVLYYLPTNAVVQLADPNGQGALSQALLWALSPTIAYACITGVIFARVAKRLRDSANLDVLTGAHSRRFLIEATTRILDKSKDRLPEEATSLLLIDIDHFKSINDKWGHLVGDAVLKHCVICIQEVIRANDRVIQKNSPNNIVGRYGGEEFCVVLPFTAMTGATVVAERLRKKVAESPYLFGEHKISITVSIGVVLQESNATFESMLNVADKRLYRAKETGRNIVVHGGEIGLVV
jgi:diguanylate cyclase (GGDEF)-like protein